MTGDQRPAIEAHNPDEDEFKKPPRKRPPMVSGATKWRLFGAFMVAASAYVAVQTLKTQEYFETPRQSWKAKVHHSLLNGTLLDTRPFSGGKMKLFRVNPAFCNERVSHCYRIDITRDKMLPKRLAMQFNIPYADIEREFGVSVDDPRLSKVTFTTPYNYTEVLKVAGQSVGNPRLTDIPIKEPYDNLGGLGGAEIVPFDKTALTFMGYSEHTSDYSDAIKADVRKQLARIKGAKMLVCEYPIDQASDWRVFFRDLFNKDIEDIRDRSKLGDHPATDTLRRLSFFWYKTRPDGVDHISLSRFNHPDNKRRHPLMGKVWETPREQCPVTWNAHLKY